MREVSLYGLLFNENSLSTLESVSGKSKEEREERGRTEEDFVEYLHLLGQIGSVINGGQCFYLTSGLYLIL